MYFDALLGAFLSLGQLFYDVLEFVEVSCPDEVGVCFHNDTGQDGSLLLLEDRTQFLDQLGSLQHRAPSSINYTLLALEYKHGLRCYVALHSPRHTNTS